MPALWAAEVWGSLWTQMEKHGDQTKMSPWPRIRVRLGCRTRDGDGAGWLQRPSLGGAGSQQGAQVEDALSCSFMLAWYIEIKCPRETLWGYHCVGSSTSRGSQPEGTLSLKPGSGPVEPLGIGNCQRGKSAQRQSRKGRILPPPVYMITQKIGPYACCRDSHVPVLSTEAVNQQRAIPPRGRFERLLATADARQVHANGEAPCG